MIGLAILLALAAAAYGIAQRFRLPIIPLLLGAGILVSLTGWIGEPAAIETAVELGLTFLAFSFGIELNPERVIRQRRGVLWVGLLQFLVVGAAGFVVGVAFGFGPLASAYIGFGLSTSSTLVILRHLRRNQQMFEPFGRLVTGVLLLQDFAMIGFLVAASRIGEGAGAIALGLVEVTILAAAAYFCRRKLAPLVILRLRLDGETALLFMLTLMFLFVGGAAYFNLPLIAGAFLAGFSLSAFPVNGIARGLLASLSEFFMAIFFAAVGALALIPSGPALLLGLLLAGFVFLITPPLVTVVAERVGLTSRGAIEAGLLLAQTSELSLVLGLAGVRLGHIDPELFSALALAMILTMSVTPFVANDRAVRAMLPLHPRRWQARARLRRRLPERPSGHILVLGFGAGGMWVVRPLLAAGHHVIVVDDDPVVIDELHRAKIPSVRGDGSDEEVLEAAGAAQARLIISSLRRVQDSERVLHSVPKNVPVTVRVFEDHEAERVRAAGGIPIVTSEAAAQTFLEWLNATIPDPQAAAK